MRKKQTLRVQQTRDNAKGKHPNEWYVMGESSESRRMKRKKARAQAKLTREEPPTGCDYGIGG
jgi:hypothetical protein